MNLKLTARILPYVIIAIMAVIIVIMQNCQDRHKIPDCPPVTTTTTTVTIKGDSIPVPYPVYIVTKKDSVVYRDVPAKVDTLGILIDYYAEHYGTDTIVDNKDFLISIKWITFMNKLKKVTPYIKKKEQTLSTTTTTTPGVAEINYGSPRLKVFIGMAVGKEFGQNKLKLKASAALLTKKDFLYAIHYDVLYKEFDATIYYKLRFR